jgi:hypothetical protein
MPNNPRLDTARKYLGLEHRYAETMLARIDAEDPMRREPSGEAVEAALNEWFSHAWRQMANSDGLFKSMRKALTAALAVMAGENVEPDPKPPDPKPEWTAAKEALLRFLSARMAGHGAEARNAWTRDERAHYARLQIDAFTKPEPVWPPKDCTLLQQGANTCLHYKECGSPICPHAGERADG